MSPLITMRLLSSNNFHFTFFLLLLCSSIILSHATFNLDRVEYDAFMIIQRDFGIDAHHPSFTTTPCNDSPAVSCEPRLLEHSSSAVFKITRIIFDSEQLDGFISPLIGQLSELQELTLTNNRLIENIPQEISYCQKLEVLYLRNNLLSGNVPSELSKLVHLRVLDLSFNKLSGDLSFLRYFPNLQKLSLADNFFVGKIPASVSSFGNLKHFDISGNEHIQGPVPVLKGLEDIKSEASTKSRIHRRFILDRNSTRAAGGPAQAPTPSVPPHAHRKNAKRLIPWLIGLIAGGFIGLFSGVAISIISKAALSTLGRKETSFGVTIFSKEIKKKEDIAFLEKEDGVSNLQIIGKGGCGEVYKAILPGCNNLTIAIKKISHPPRDSIIEEDRKEFELKMRQIRSEIQTVGQIRHRNVLPLLAHVTRHDCQFLVYKFINNGSLQGKLVREQRDEFDWPTRYRVALGVATGLEYIHMNNNPRIIHRDLKPDNILLDDDLEPLIADFGFAKEMAMGDTHASTQNVAGTRGYLPPEVTYNPKLTEKGDIYSFGVVLANLVTGMLPNDQFLQGTNDVYLVPWMRNLLNSENPRAALDPVMLGNGYEEQMIQVAKIACFCTNKVPKDRPNAKDIRCMLSQIKDSQS